MFACSSRQASAWIYARPGRGWLESPRSGREAVDGAGVGVSPILIQHYSYGVGPQRVVIIQPHRRSATPERSYAPTTTVQKIK
jgi:hypothetical protein